MKRFLLNQNHSIIVETLLFGSNGLNDEENACIIESTIEYMYIYLAERLSPRLHCMQFIFLNISHFFIFFICVYHIHRKKILQTFLISFVGYRFICMVKLF